MFCVMKKIKMPKTVVFCCLIIGIILLNACNAMQVGEPTLSPDYIEIPDEELVLEEGTAVPPITPQPFQTVVPTPTPQNQATAVPESNESQMDLSALKATPTPSPTAMPTPDPDVVLITDEPIFVGGDVRLQGWSPDGRFLAYFEYTEEELAQSPVYIRGTAHGTLIFYDTVTGQKCQRYSLDGRFPYEGPEFGQRFTWLPNGDLLIFTEDGQAIQADAPCGDEENLTALFPEPIQSIGFFLDDQLLLLTGTMAYWLYSAENHTIYPIAEITPDSMNNLVMSPEGTYIGVTLAGNYTGFRSPIGGSRVVDAATGQIVARYDWEPSNGVDGTQGGPIWLNKQEMVITFSLDQEPFFMTVDGAVRPLLALFGYEFEGDPHLPIADVYVEPDSGQYHILLTEVGGREEKNPPQVYHSDTGTIELIEFDFNSGGNVYLQPGGILLAYTPDSNWRREITAVNGPWIERTQCNPLWPFSTTPYFTRSYSADRVDIYDWPNCELLAKLQLTSRYEGVTHVAGRVSANGQWAALVLTGNDSRGRALFVIPLPELEGMNP